MRSSLLAWSLCGSLTYASDVCTTGAPEVDADASSLLQARSLVRKQHAQQTDANELLKSVQDIANSFTKDSDMTKTPEEVSAALGVAGAALQTMLPLFEQQNALAEREIEHAFQGLQACHNEHGGEVRARVEHAVAEQLALSEQCDEALAEATAAEHSACEGQGEVPTLTTAGCACNEARTAMTDQGALCDSREETHGAVYCQLLMSCAMLHECHDESMNRFVDLRADMEAALLVRQQEYITFMQVDCLTSLITEAMLSLTPIDHASLIACNDVDVGHLDLDFPDPPNAPAECPEPQSGDPRCGEDGSYVAGPPSHLDPEGSNACSTESVSENNCLQEVQGLLPEGQGQGRRHLVAGSWAHVPVGCSVQSGGDWAAHFNRRASGSNDGGYSPVCTEAAATSTLVAHLEPEASNACSTASMSEAECLEAVRLLLPGGQAQGRPHLVAGSWGHVPVGCSVQSGGDWAAHFNRRNAGSNDGGYSPVCTGAAATNTLVAHLEPRASNACSTASMSEVECLEAVRLLLPGGQAQGRRHLVAGSWAHVPVGCSVQSGGDWAAHFNRRGSGSNDGGYSPVCTGPQVANMLVAHMGVAASDTCGSTSVNEAECLEAVRALLPAGQAQGRSHLVAGAWGHVPTGCSVQSGGDWAAHFNRRASGNNDGGYSPVCNGPPTPQLRNGNLEEGFSTGSYEYTHNVPGWAASGGTVSCRSGNGPWGGVSSQGNYYVALQGTGAAVQQGVRGHIRGNKYRLQLTTAQRQNSPGGRGAILRITASGVQLMSEHITSSGFEEIAVTYTATDSTVDIRLENVVGGGDQTVFVDAIQIHEAPPGSEYQVFIDRSNSNTRCVTSTVPITCAADAGDLASRLNSHRAHDRFDITVNGNQVCARRLDHNGGWGMHLRIPCIVA